MKVIGVQVDAIERGEDRNEFKKTMASLSIEMARSEVANTVEEAVEIAERLGYPCVLRPAYTMGGTGGGLVYNIDDCARWSRAACKPPLSMKYWSKSPYLAGKSSNSRSFAIPRTI